MELDERFAASLRETASLAASVRGAEEGSVRVVLDGGTVSEIKRKATKGMQGKINFWLTRSPLSGFLVLELPSGDVGSERPDKLPRAAMAAEDCVLWLTEEGLGTCWLGGFNREALRKILGLGNETDLPAIIALGRPKPRIQAMDLDNLIYRRLSRHRKPLTEIAFCEDMRNAYHLETYTKPAFSASPVQDVRGLLRRLADTSESKGDPPLELALEACLEAARLAPNASNAQNWRFIVVSVEEAVRRLERACQSTHNWKAAIVGAALPGSMDNFLETPFWMLDLPIALSHMSLMAASMDLGVDLCLSGLDEKEINGLVGLEAPLRTVGVMGFR
jgi:nitroreductase